MDERLRNHFGGKKEAWGKKEGKADEPRKKETEF